MRVSNDKKVDERLLKTKCPNCGEYCYLKPVNEVKLVFNCSRDCNVEYDEKKHWL